MRSVLNRKVVIVGFAMFAIFFGAGNLIFPPHIGLQAGENWPIALVGLTIAGVSLPILAIFAVANAGSPERLFRPYARWFHPVFMATLLYTGSVATIIPRTGATAYESGVKVLLPGADDSVAEPVTIVVFFLIVAALALSKNKVIDRIGKYLTPALLVLLLIIVGLAVLRPMGTPEAGVADPFRTSFITSYQTGDVATGLLTGGIFIAALAAHGYSTPEARTKPLMAAAGVAFVGLFVVYGGLEYLGAQGSATYPADTDETVLLNGVVADLGGSLATVALAVAVLFATLTTAAGMATVIAEFTEGLTRGRLRFGVTIAITTVIFIVQALGGVSYIITFSTPFLLVFYPAMIVTVILGLLKPVIPNDGVWKGALLGALLLGLYDSVEFICAQMGSQLPGGIVRIHHMIPLAENGFGWILPALLGAFIGGLIWRICALPNAEEESEEAPDGAVAEPAKS